MANQFVSIASTNSAAHRNARRGKLLIWGPPKGHAGGSCHSHRCEGHYGRPRHQAGERETSGFGAREESDHRQGRHDDESGKRVITYSLPRNPFLENAKKSARFYNRMRRLRAKTLLVPLPHHFAVIRFLLLTLDCLLGGFLQVHFHCLRKRSVRFGIDSFGVND